MSIRVFPLILAFAVFSAVSAAQEPKAADERPLIEQAARDYIEGWYAADAARMERALHPDLMKRYVVDVAPGRQMLRNVTRDNMVEMTRAGGGSKTPPERRNIAVNILEVSGDILRPSFTTISAWRRATGDG